MREKCTKRFIRGGLVSAIIVSLTMNFGIPVYASTPAPTVTSVSPNSGPTTGGTVVTITGTNLTNPSGGIKIGGIYATNVHVDSDSQITATTPNMPLTYKGGIVDVIVITAGGPSATSTNDQFTYYVPTPTVTSVSPNSGPTTGGTVVTIKGTHLTYPTGVKIGGYYVTNVNANKFEPDNDNQITATIPAVSSSYSGTLTTMNITVTTVGGTSATSINDQFTYIPGTIHTLTYIPGANGNIKGALSQPINIGYSGSTVTAAPNSGYHFVNWSDGVTTESRTDTNVISDINVTANFALDLPTTYALTYTAGSNGTITGILNQTVNNGDSGSTVTAVPNSGYHFVNWSDGNTSESRTDTNINADTSVTANFALNLPTTYTLTYIAGANGTITGILNQTVNSGNSGSTVTAVPNSGYHFVDWSDGVTIQSRTDINVISDINVTANFALDLPTTYALTYTAGSNGTITGILNQTVNSGNSGSTVTAVPNSGYHFVDWSDGVTTQSRTDTNVSADTSVTANFALNSSSQNDPTPIETVTTPASVIIEGTERVGNTLESQLLSKNGTNFTTSSAVTYEWYRLSSKYSETGSLIGNNKTYKLVSSDQDNYIKVLAICNGKTFEDITGTILKRSSSSSSSSSSSHHNSLKSNNSSNNGSTIVTNGWETMDDNIRRYIKNGQVVTGWIKSDNEWYYLRENGVMTTGWEQIGGNWYLFNINGTMVTGWANINDKWYFLKSNGAMATGWEQVGGNWYLFNISGAMVTGWANIDEKWYYLYTDGSMASNTLINSYRLDENGVWVK